MKKNPSLKKLTLEELGKLYLEAKKNEGCERCGCGRKIKYIYLYEGQPIYMCCGYHQLRENKK